MSDAVIALTTNVAVKQANEGTSGFIQFKDSWYDIDSDDTPDGSSVEKEYQQLIKA